MSMTLEQFQRLIEDPRRTKDELIIMRTNAISKNAFDFVNATESVLNKRFLDWQKLRSRQGGKSPVDIDFLGIKKHFETQQEAYIWLCERFISHYPQPFLLINWEMEFIGKGERVLFFARSLDRLLGEENMHLKWHQFTNGWYGRIGLSEAQKLNILTKFSAVAKLKFGVDWDWNDKGKCRSSLLDQF